MIHENASNDEIFAALRALTDPKPAAVAKADETIVEESETYITAEVVEAAKPKRKSRKEKLEPLEVVEDDPLHTVPAESEAEEAPVERNPILPLPPELVAFAKAFTARDESRPVLSCVHIQHVGGWTVFTGADGFILGEMARVTRPDHASDWNILVPAQQIIDMFKAVGKGASEVMIEKRGDEWYIGSPIKQVWSRLHPMDGRFPQADTIFAGFSPNKLDAYALNPIYMERMGQFCKSIGASAFKLFFNSETSGGYCMPMGSTVNSKGHEADELSIRILWMPMVVDSEGGEERGPKSWPVPQAK